MTEKNSKHPDEVLVVSVTNGDGVVCGRWSYQLRALVSSIERASAKSDVQGARAFNALCAEITHDLEIEVRAAFQRVIENKALNGGRIR